MLGVANSDGRAESDPRPLICNPYYPSSTGPLGTKANAAREFSFVFVKCNRKVQGRFIGFILLSFYQVGQI
jgi:hypothetical protein